MATPGRQLIDGAVEATSTVRERQEQNVHSPYKYLGKQMHSQEDDEFVSSIICQTNEERMLTSLAGIRLSGMNSKSLN